VVLRGEQVDAAGAAIADTRREKVIAREVTLDLARELRDTRLPPGAAVSLVYRMPRAPGAHALRLSVVVEPDAFYTRFFETLLEQDAGRGEAALRTALATTRESPYVLFSQELRF
jgi:hypothetical protein